MADPGLTGVSVLLTRPPEQSAELAAAIESRGGAVVVFPALEIVARPAADVAGDGAALQAADISIFISRNAVDHGLDWAAGSIAAIGPTTAAAIEAGGRNVDILPASGYDSEALLAQPAMQDVSGKVVRILRGDGGRELLADALRERGATVEYLSTYERRMPTPSAETIAELDRRWGNGDIDAVVSMSVQSLTNLHQLLPDACRNRLRQTPLVTPSARVLKEAENRFPGCPANLAAGPQATDSADAIVTAVGGHNGTGTH